jgi:hypothetical protein
MAIPDTLPVTSLDVWCWTFTASKGRAVRTSMCRVYSYDYTRIAVRTAGGQQRLVFTLLRVSHPRLARLAIARGRTRATTAVRRYKTVPQPTSLSYTIDSLRLVSATAFSAASNFSRKHAIMFGRWVALAPGFGLALAPHGTARGLTERVIRELRPTKILSAVRRAWAPACRRGGRPGR